MSKKNKTLEEFVAENRKHFETDKPSDKLWLAIAGELDKPRKKFGFSIFEYPIKYAAAVSVIFMCGFLVHKYLDANMANAYSQNALAEEYLKAERYYQREVNYIRQNIGDIQAIDQSIEEDIKELDFVYNELKNEFLNNEAPKEIIIREMINNYQLRISLLETILLRTQNISNDTYDENELSL
jgi:low affinity Fe/Cu permease